MTCWRCCVCSVPAGFGGWNHWTVVHDDIDRGRLSQSPNIGFDRGKDAEDRWIQFDLQAGWETDSKSLAYATQDA